jgi:hypothetical protein
MAFTKTATPTALAGILVTSTSLNVTSNDNVTGNTSGLIYQIQIDNSVNPDTTIYVKVADAASAAAATTIAKWVLPVRGGQRMTYIMDVGVAYASGVSVWCTTGSATGSQGSPATAISISILAS